jgi:hypothetical protein
MSVQIPSILLSSNYSSLLHGCVTRGNIKNQWLRIKVCKKYNDVSSIITVPVAVTLSRQFPQRFSLSE